jgi:hypothetical protein
LQKIETDFLDFLISRLAAHEQKIETDFPDFLISRLPAHEQPSQMNMISIKEDDDDKILVIRKRQPGKRAHKKKFVASLQQIVGKDYTLRIQKMNRIHSAKYGWRDMEYKNGIEVMGACSMHAKLRMGKPFVCYLKKAMRENKIKGYSGLRSDNIVWGIRALMKL